MKRRNFSLIELMVVIAIIAVLAGIAFPVLSSVNRKGKETKARSEINALVMAIKQYEADYGTLPWGGGTDLVLTDDNYNVMLEILMNTTPSGDATTNGNPRHTRYLDPPAQQVTPNGGSAGYYFLDPWQNRYHVALDLNYDGRINCSSINKSDSGTVSNFGGETGTLMGKVLVYSGNDSNQVKEYIKSWKTSK